MKLEATNAASERVIEQSPAQPNGASPIASNPTSAGFETTIILCEALRVWHHQRTEGDPVQPALYTLLASRGFCILAPVLDGLFRCAEMALGRQLIVGAGCTMSADEAWLASLIGLARRDASGWTITDPQRAALLEGAARSARIMLREALI
ncbi:MULTISPECIES: hypothetical protein [Sphingomonadaceae]|uniref:hypothetical protein n=1 Tax=Sphingomonadales TaxID=204457 RepID=UPI000AE054A0|nr:MULTISPECIES: hypothetical protein [Sphingomonadaceae]